MTQGDEMLKRLMSNLDFVEQSVKDLEAELQRASEENALMRQMLTDAERQQIDDARRDR